MGKKVKKGVLTIPILVNKNKRLEGIRHTLETEAYTSPTYHPSTWVVD